MTRIQRQRREQRAELRRLARQVQVSSVRLGDKYLSLCKYIREQELHPKQVSKELGELGFHRSTVSQIMRVAFALDESWADFEARRIGFKRALNLARVSARELLAKETGQDIEAMTNRAREAGLLGGYRATGGSEEKNAESIRLAAQERAAIRLLKLCAELGVRSRTWRRGKFRLRMRRIEILEDGGKPVF